MDNPAYILIVFPEGKDRNDRNSRFGYITKEQYSLLQEDFVHDIESDGKKFAILEKRFSRIRAADGHIFQAILDVKPLS